MIIEPKGMRSVASFFNKGQFEVKIYRDLHDKWFVINNGSMTQERLSDEEIVRYLAHAANREVL